jgi:LuxR family transcriptional activator of conjugal transfer of Ti plasmids
MAEPQIHLTVREKQCLYWLAVGKSLSLTADILEIKKDTVRHYLKLARGKLGADNTINAVHVATRLGLI